MSLCVPGLQRSFVARISVSSIPSMKPEVNCAFTHPNAAWKRALTTTLRKEMEKKCI
jgi:hypothetical protein